MQHLRLTTRPDPEAAPAAFRLLAASEHAAEARLVGVNPADSRGVTALFVVDGDREGLVAALRDAPETADVDAAPAADGWFSLLATVRADVAPLVETVFETLAGDGLVVLPPVVYRDGAVHAEVAGTAAAVQRVVDRMPPVVDVEVHAVGERGAVHDPVAALSERQREAVRAAVDLGYYDQPRRATHEDVADRLGCAASTASEHLRKAESKLVRAAAE